MSQWNTKSESSFKAANKLIIEGLFNSSVHASYYSCVQLMLHVMSTHYGLDDDAIDNLNRTSGMTTHKHLKVTIYDSLRQINPDYAVDFNDDIGTLCDRRVVADYKSEIIQDKESKDLRQLAYETLRMLKTSYSL